MTDDSEFFRAYETPSGNAVTLKTDDDEEGPGIAFFVKPQGYGVCRFGMNWNTENERDTYWSDKLTQDVVNRIALMIVNLASDEQTETTASLKEGD